MPQKITSILNKTKKNIIADKGIVADSCFSRMKGLLGRKSINEKEALVITKCRSIHMVFMRFAIDVIFVDKNDYVVGLVERIHPFCLSPIFFKASYAIELAAGSIKQVGVSHKDLLEIIVQTD